MRAGARRDATIRASLSSGLAILMALVASHAAECPTVTCTMDHGEVADRTSALALTLFAVGSVLLWAKTGVPSVLATMDTGFLLTLAVVSSDVNVAAHNYIAICFVSLRLVVLVVAATRRGASLDLPSLYLIAALRVFAFGFLVGYACPQAVPEACGRLAGPRLSRVAALATETGILVTGVLYMLYMNEGTRPAWTADLLVPACLCAAVVASVALAVARFSVGGTVLLGVGVLMDGTLLARLWRARRTAVAGRRAVTWASLPLATILLAPMLYLVA